MFTIRKQPNEVLVGVSIAFDARLLPGEVVSSGTVTVTKTRGTEGQANPMTVDNVDNNDTTVMATISGGYDNCDYELTYIATCSLGNVFESEIKVICADL
jgi:hypothetical protein